MFNSKKIKQLERQMDFVLQFITDELVDRLEFELAQEECSVCTENVCTEEPKQKSKKSKSLSSKKSK